MTTHAYGGDPTGLAGKHHYGSGALGTRGDAIPSTGTHGPGYIYNSLSLPADDAKEYYGVLGTIPAGVHIDAGEDSGIEAYADVDGTYVIPWTLYQFGVSLGATSFTLTFGDGSMLDGDGTTFALTSGTGAVTVEPSEPGIINLAGSNAAFGASSGTGEVEIVPYVPSVINLSGSSCSLGMSSTSGSISIGAVFISAYTRYTVASIDRTYTI